MQGRLLTFDTVDDQLIARDFAEELERENATQKDDNQQSKETNVKRRSPSVRSGSTANGIEQSQIPSHNSSDDTNGNEDRLTAVQEDRLNARSGFYVPALFRKWHDGQIKRKTKQDFKSNEDEEKANPDANQTSFRIPSSSSRTKYRRTPVFSGTIAPFAIMLEIPGFTSKWYVHITPDGQPNVYRPNPILLDVGLSFSLASAIVANLAILARFSERMRPRKATAIACTGFIVHDVINLVALIIFGVIHAVDDGFTYSEAYWMTTASTVASLCCTISLIVDYVRTKDFKDAGSGLTRKQSQLVIVIMAFLTYISLSAMIFALVLPLPFLDAMYFSVESLATIGLGDIVPDSVASKILLFFIAPGGIILLAVMVAIARQTILEAFEDAYKRRRQQYKQKLAERQKERKQHRQERAQIRLHMSRQMKKMKDSNGQNIQFPEEDEGVRSRTLSRQNTFDSFFTGGPLSRTWTFQSGTDEDLDGSIQQDFRDPSELSLSRTSSIANSASATSKLHQFEEDLITQRKGIESRFEQYRSNLAKAHRNEFWLKLSISAILFACFWLVGAAVFSAIESDWSFFDGFYFIFVVFTSIGYGDFHPTSSSGRAFFIVWALFGVGILTVLFSVVSDAWGNVIQQRKFKFGRKERRHGKLRRKVNGAFNRFIPSQMRGRKKTEKKKEQERSEQKQMEKGKPSIRAMQSTHNNDESSSQSGGGILLNLQEFQNKEGTDSNLESNTNATKMDTVQMHLDLTNTAMEFHKSALGYMTILRESLQSTIHEIPEIVQALHTLNQSDHHEKVSQEDRDKILALANSTQEPKVIRALEQTLLVHDFESILHNLIHSSTSFLDELKSRDEELENAVEEIQRLKKRDDQSIHPNEDDEQMNRKS